MKSPWNSSALRSFLFYFAAGMGAFLLWVGMARSLTIAYPSGAVDFRNRVVAARQAELGLNPYLFKWTPAHPETLLDPSEEPDAKFSRLTSPPTTLWVQSWFANADYRTQKSANFWLNWLCFALVPVWMASMLLREYPRKLEFLSILLFVSGTMACSGIWLFHLERGQQYSYFAILLVMAAFPPRWKTDYVRRGATALSVYFRPTLGLDAALSFQNRRPIRDLLLVAAFGILILIPVFAKYPLEWWKDYFACTHDWYLRRYGLHERVIPLISSPYPAAPEGDPFLSRFSGFGVPGNVVYHYISNWTGIFIPYSAGMLATLALSFYGFFQLWRARKEPRALFALRLFSALYLIDMALPSPRSGYNAVIFFPGLLLAALYGTVSTRVFGIIGLFYSLWSLKNPYSSPYGVETFYILCAVVALVGKVRRVEA